MQMEGDSAMTVRIRCG